jgi:hypothetical protein
VEVAVATLLARLDRVELAAVALVVQTVALEHLEQSMPAVVAVAVEPAQVLEPRLETVVLVLLS